MHNFFSSRAIELATLALLAMMLATMLGGCNTVEVQVSEGSTATITLDGTEQTRGNNSITPATDVSVSAIPGT